MTEKLDKFNKCAALIFDSLYQSFPVPKDFQIEDFSEFITEEDRDIFFSTMRFLEKEGFIRYENAVYRGYISVTLTAKGLVILNSTPKSIDSTESLGSKITVAVKSGAQEMMKAVIGEAIKAIANLS